MQRWYWLVAAAAVSGGAVVGEAQTRGSIDVVHEASIAQLEDGLRGGRWTSVQLVDAYLARIVAYDQSGPAINAMIRLNPAARREAAQRDAERRRGMVRGPLHGIPIVLKDNFDTFDMPTSAGSLALARVQPPDDGFVVKRLRDAGAVILGKTNMHELAAGITSVSSLGGQTRNPYDPMRCPGGSSGGTGAAIAASFAAVGWGSDTCGSIRIPAAYNNLVGLRPTQGMVSRDGVVPLSHTQDIPGPLARNARDLAIALDATVGFDPADSVTRRVEGRRVAHFVDSLEAYPVRGTRVGLLLNYTNDDVDADIRDSIRAVTRAMQGAGATVVDVRVPDLDSLVARSSVINYETDHDLRAYLATIPGAPSLTAAGILARGEFHDAMLGRIRAMDSTGTLDNPAYRAALAKQPVVRARLIAIMDSLGVDVLAYPTMRRRPVLVGEVQPGGTCFLSAHTGLPAISAPAGVTNDGLPLGIEFLGRPFSDVRLVALAHGLESLLHRRTAPSTTPALRGGKPPAPHVSTVRSRAGAAVATTQFTYDPLANTLRYQLLVTGVAPRAVQAVVLRRVDAGPGGAPVIHRLAGPGMLRASGALPLTGRDRLALTRGALRVTVFTWEATGEASVPGFPVP